MEHSIRYPTKHDHNYIISSWRRSLKQKHSHYRKFIPHAIYNNWFSEYSNGILLQGSKVLLAVNPADLEQIFGFIIYRPQSPPIIHYLYVKSLYHGLGLGTTLLKRAGVKDNKILCSTLTDEVKVNRKYNIVYLPNYQEYYV